MKKISKYQIFTELQHGPITHVYKAIQPELQRTVLVKQLNPDRVADEELVERFKQEGSILAKINSANVITIFDFGYENGVPFLVTEFIEGNTLAELLQKVGHFPWDIGLYVLQQIAAGLQAIHQHNIIHQDIKPANIFISDQGEVKLGDLGFSVSLEDQAKLVQGTPAYLAPEVILKSEMDFRGDLYALGLVGYELLTGENPFAAKDMQTILNRIVTLNPLKVQTVRPDVPAEFSNIIATLMARNPDDRLQSARQLLQKLENFRTSRGIKVDSNALGSFLEAPDSYQMTPVIVEEKVIVVPDQKQPRQKRVWLTAGLVVTAIILIFFIKQLSDGFTFFKKQNNSSVVNQEQNATSGNDQIDTTIIMAQRNSDKPTGTGSKPFAKPTDTDHAISDTLKIPTITDMMQDTLIISSDPKAVVFVNNDSLGVTPVQFYFSATNKQFDVEFRTPGFPVIKKAIAATGQAVQKFHINLWQEVAFLDLQIIPWGEIWIDGDSIDVSPLNRLIVLPHGNHRLMVRNPTLKSVTLPFSVAIGETLKKTIELHR
ncbi:MAG TPA: serine/threonine-protein kinase [bacterium]